MKRIALVIVAVALLVSSSSALADPTCSTYSSVCSVTNNTSPTNTNTVAGAGAGNGTGPINASTSQSTLPFTGLDVLLLAAGGGTLLGAGLVVRRLSRGVS